MQPKPITILRSAIFDVFFFLWMFIASFTGYLLALAGQRAALSKWASIWGYGFHVPEKLILGLDYTLEGHENLPPAPYIVAMQHQSAWETFQLFFWFPDAVIVFKKELLKVPFLGRCLKTYGGIPVARSKKAEDLKQFLTSAKTIVRDKRNIVIFPQGTRTQAGEKATYNKGVAVLYDSLQIPLVPVTLDSGQYWGREKFLKYPGTIKVRIHPAIMPGQPREEVMAKIQALFENS
jgi:1-acyl-sn-glycerol-3-phosphate acyltransferase